MAMKKPTHTFKCFSSVSKMRLLQIIANFPKMRGQIQVVHPTGVNNPELNEEMEEEVVEQIALPVPKWNYKEMELSQ